MLKTPDSVLMAFYLTRPAVSKSILDQFVFNSQTTAVPGSVFGRRHVLGTGEIEIAFARPFLWETKAMPQLQFRFEQV